MWLDKTSFLECCVRTVLIDGLHRPGRDLHGYELLKLRHPHALGAKIGLEVAGSGSRHVLTDATFLLGETPTMNFAAA